MSGPNDPQEAMAYAAAGLLSPGFAKAVAKNRHRFGLCVHHGEVVLVDTVGQPTDGPDGTCPHCKRDRDAGIRIGCAEHGSQPRDQVSGRCLVCVALGRTADVAPGAQYHVDGASIPDSLIHPPEIFNPEAPSADGVAGDGGPGVVGREAVHETQQLRDAASRGSAGDRPSGEDPRGTVRQPGGGGAFAGDALIEGAAVLERIGTLKIKVRDGRPEPEEFVQLGQLMRRAREMGLM